MMDIMKAAINGKNHKNSFNTWIFSDSLEVRMSKTKTIIAIAIMGSVGMRIIVLDEKGISKESGKKKTSTLA